MSTALAFVLNSAKMGYSAIASDFSYVKNRIVVVNEK
jgi:hypothetical protein